MRSLRIENLLTVCAPCAPVDRNVLALTRVIRPIYHRWFSGPSTDYGNGIASRGKSFIPAGSETCRRGASATFELPFGEAGGRGEAITLAEMPIMTRAMLNALRMRASELYPLPQR